MNSNLTLTAVLFAGGESRRIGVDKAALIFDGEPFWSRQLRTLRELQPEKLLISARARPSWCPSEIETVLDASPARGPLSGLAAALTSIQTTHLLALAVDMPLMSAAYLDKLSGRARKGCGVVVDAGDYHEPMAAIYPREALAAVRRFADNGGTAFQPLLAILVAEQLMTAVRISSNEKKFFQNINTRRDLEARI